MVTVPDDFAGIVSVSLGDAVEFEQAYGLADRAHGVPFTVDTRAAIASGTKGFTALTTLLLSLDGSLDLDAPVRPVLGADLPLVGDEVTARQLLTHTAGIGDYCDEELPAPPPLKAPVQTLVTAEAYLPVLDGFPAKSPPGTRFSYCNSGYAVLAIVAGRVAGVPFDQLLRQRVFEPAGMTSTGFLRSDYLPGDAAIGYLDDGRTNVFELPVIGSGDGGAYTTVADIRAFWAALSNGTFDPRCLAAMTTRGTQPTDERYDYGMGLWLARSSTVVFLEGGDFGVSFRSWHDPSTGRVATVVNNTTEGAWPVATSLGAEHFGIEAAP